MQLLIHYGIYKTGSSFIQTICARNKAHLESSGIYFPESKYDDRMIAGEISPGNSSGLTMLLKELNEIECRKLISGWKREAEKRSCNRILISDEALIHVFAIRESLIFFNQILDNLNFQHVSCFAYFRDPVDHCISTFKHRAKRGTIPDYEFWVKNTYETFLVIKSFLSTYQHVKFHWKFNAYQKDGKDLLSKFFLDWLGIQLPNDISYPSVNPSLSLSELKFIQIIRNKNERLVPYVYDAFLRVPKSGKANDSFAEELYRSIASAELSKYQDVLDSLNSLLPDGEKLIIKSKEILEKNKKENDILLSEKQVNAIFDAFYLSSKMKSILIDFLKRVKRAIFRKGKK
jgi:hypothetical protein